MVQSRISDPRVIQYWDNDHLVAEALHHQLSSEPSCCQRRGILWDLAALYGKQAKWGNSSPVFAGGPVVDAAPDVEKRLASDSKGHSATRQLAEFVAVLSGSLFTGASVYINLVEHC